MIYDVLDTLCLCLMAVMIRNTYMKYYRIYYYINRFDVTVYLLYVIVTFKSPLLLVSWQPAILTYPFGLQNTATVSGNEIIYSS